MDGTSGKGMRFDPAIHHRRSIRLKDYDYSQTGAYFVTLCTQSRAFLFGEIMDGKMCLNDVGRMIQSVWDELPQHYPGIVIDAFVVMPNHIHGILVLTLVGAGPCACPSARVEGQPQGVAPTMLLSDVVHSFKSFTTTRYRQGVTRKGWPAFAGRLWQRNYYEHIIRNEDELNGIRPYIDDNRLRWEMDRENPAAQMRKGEEAWQV